MGLEAIASRLALDLETLRDVHEPWLERLGLVERTERGRVATEAARAWYGAGSFPRINGFSGQKPWPSLRDIPVLPFTLGSRSTRA